MGKYSRALLREALTHPKILLERTKFRRWDVAQELFEEIGERTASTPEDALALAEIAPKFVQSIAASRSETGEHELHLAHLLLASAYRAVGRYSDANVAFEAAKSIDVPEAARSEYYRRRSYLLIHQGRADAALEHAQRAVEILRTQGDLFVRHPLGLALETRGYVHYYREEKGSAGEDFSAALALIDHRTCARAYYGAIHNLATLLIESAEPSEVDKTLRHLQAAYSRFVGNAKVHIAKYKLRWLQALALKRFGADRRAEVYLQFAREGLIKIGAFADAAVVSMDLGLLYFEQARAAELLQLSRETLARLRTDDLPTQARAAVRLWQKAGTDLTYELLREYRTTALSAVPRVRASRPGGT